MRFADAVGEEGLAERVGARLVSALRKTYAANAERHDESLGDDALTFGVLVWRDSWFQLEVEVSSVPGVSTSRPKGSLAIVVGRTVIHPYKVGFTENVQLEKIRLTGTITKDRLAANNSQLSLFGGDSPSVEVAAKSVNLVLGHAGNPFDGLCGAWIGAPTVNEEGPAWLWTEEIFRIPPDQIRRTGEPVSPPPFLPFTEMPLSEIDLSLLPDVQSEPEAED